MQGQLVPFNEHFLNPLLITRLASVRHEHIYDYTADSVT